MTSTVRALSFPVSDREGSGKNSGPSLLRGTCTPFRPAVTSNRASNVKGTVDTARALAEPGWPAQAPVWNGAR